MSRQLSKVWWLLALCGALDAMHAAMNLLMLNPDGWLSLRFFAGSRATWDMSVLALSAGACAMAAGLWNLGRDHHWLLSLHGLALGAFGLIGVSSLVRGPLSFRPVSLLFVVMALSIAAFALATAPTMQRLARTVLRLAGVASAGFALLFFAVGFHFVRLGAPGSFFAWMSCYFSFCAIFMLWLAFHVRGQHPSKSAGTKALSSLLRPAH